MICHAIQRVHFITENIADTITELSKQEGKNIGVTGSGELTAILLSANLTDEMQILHIPAILGKDIPLFSGQDQESKRELIGSKPYENGVLHVTYQRK
ncbi:MAG: dihydrofolate reductase family protein [Prevotella sp.]|jgi:dihydrofolate reductase|nr:dihydrofolate reductase family protein [Prevotella sp.]